MSLSGQVNSLATRVATEFNTVRSEIAALPGGGSGTVTSITFSSPLTGNTITTSGTVGINQSELDVGANRIFVAGRKYTTPMAVGTAAASNSIVRFMPFMVPVATTFTNISCQVVTSATNSTVRMGIYSSDANDVPSTLLVDAGTVPSTSTGTKTLTINQTLQPGLYWLASLTATASPTLVVSATTQLSIPFVPCTPSGATPYSSSWTVTIAGGGLPSTVTPTLSTANQCVILWLGL